MLSVWFKCGTQNCQLGIIDSIIEVEFVITLNDDLYLVVNILSDFEVFNKGSVGSDLTSIAPLSVEVKYFNFVKFL